MQTLYRISYLEAVPSRLHRSATFGALGLLWDQVHEPARPARLHVTDQIARSNDLDSLTSIYPESQPSKDLFLLETKGT